MGIPIRLSADFPTETLQVEWHDIFKVMKGKNLQPRIPYPTRLIQIRWSNQKLSRQAKVKRIQQHETSFTTNAKGTSLGRKYKRRKRPTENQSNTIKKTVIGSYISIITLNVNGLQAPTGWADENVCMCVLPLTTSL